MDEMADNGIESCDVLGWEWEMGLHDTISERRGAAGLTCARCRSRGRSWSAGIRDADAVRFFELAYVDLDVKRSNGGVRGAQGLRDPERGADPPRCASGSRAGRT